MAKDDINRGIKKYGPAIGRKRRLRLERTMGMIDSEISNTKPKKEPKKGKRAIFIEKYRTEGYEEAKKIINEGFNKEVYNDDILKKWLDEENER